MKSSKQIFEESVARADAVLNAGGNPNHDPSSGRFSSGGGGSSRGSDSKKTSADTLFEGTKKAAKGKGLIVSKKLTEKYGKEKTTMYVEDLSKEDFEQWSNKDKDLKYEALSDFESNIHGPKDKLAAYTYIMETSFGLSSQEAQVFYEINVE